MRAFSSTGEARCSASGSSIGRTELGAKVEVDQPVVPWERSPLARSSSASANRRSRRLYCIPSSSAGRRVRWPSRSSLCSSPCRGTATAAKLITGKNIARSTITGKHVKDYSLSAAGLQRRARRHRRSRRPAGPRGMTGAKGATRRRGRPRRAGVPGKDGSRRREGREGREGRQGRAGLPAQGRKGDKGEPGLPARRATRARRASPGPRREGRQGRTGAEARRAPG